MGEIHVNYPAVLTVGIAAYLLGTIWYSPKMFARHWREAIQKSESEVNTQLKPGIYVLTFICWLIAAYVLAVIIYFSNAQTFGSGILVGFLCWFGFFASISLFMILFAGRPFKLWLINAGYALIALCLGGGILAIWR